MKILILYQSFTGNTEKVTRRIERENDLLNVETKVKNLLQKIRSVGENEYPFIKVLHAALKSFKDTEIKRLKNYLRRIINNLNNQGGIYGTKTGNV